MSSGPSLTVHLGVDGVANVQAAFAKVQSMATGVGSTLAKIGIGIAAAAGIGVTVHKIVEGVEKVVELGAGLSVLSLQTGVSVSKLVNLSIALKQAGLDSSDLGKYLRLMSKSIGEAALNGGSAAAGIERLGLNVGELAAMSPDKQFVLLADRIGKIENPTIRAATALHIFGRSGTELLPVFNNPDILRGITEGAGKFGLVMERNAHRFHEFEVAVRKIPSLGTKLFAGFADMLPFEEVTRAINDALKAVDFVEIGQKFGAFVSLVIEEWRAGRIGDLISLTIEASFEAGGLVARKAWDGVVAMLGSGEFWAQLTDAAVTAAIAITKSLTQAIYALSEPVLALQFFVVDAFRKSYADSWDMFKVLGALAVNWIAEKLEAAFAAVGKFAAALPIPGASALQGMEPKFGRIPVSAPTAAPAMSWDEAKSKAAGQVQWASSTVGGFFDRGAAASHELLGTGSDAAARGERLNELNGKLNAIIAERSKHEHAATEAAAAGIPVINAKLQLAEMEKRSKAILLDLENRRALIEGNFRITAADKWRLKKKSLEEERETLKQIVAALREKAALETDPTAKEQMLARADSHEQKLSGVNRSLGTMGPDPYSTPDQIQAAMTGLQDQFGTTAQAIARSFTSVVGSAVDSVAQGIEGLIMGTMTWGDALRNIGRTMLTTIVQAIARMFAEWIVKRGLAAAASMLFSAEEGAADTAAKAPGAVLSSISSWGIAVAVGVAAIVAAMAAFGGFESGGFTGNGPSNQVAGLVHRGEFVIPAPAVGKIGLSNLEAMRSGAVPASAGAHAPAATVSNDVRIASFDSRTDAKKWADSQDGETWFVDMAKRTSHRWSRS